MLKVICGRNMGRRGVNCHLKINDGIMRPKNYILVNSHRAIWANCGIGPNAACPVGMTFSKSSGMWNTETKPDSLVAYFAYQ